MKKVKVMGINPLMMKGGENVKKIGENLVKGVEFPCEAAIVSHDADTADKRIFRLPNGREANSLWLQIEE